MSESKFFEVFVIVLAVCVSSAYDMESRIVEGYPNGFLPDCPGTLKDAKISRGSLKHLSFVLLGKGNFLEASKENFNYFQMKALARKMDFRKKTVIYVNGYLDSAVRFPISSIIGSMYTGRGYNVLLLEYMWFSLMVYPQAVRFMHEVGNRTAEMLATLTSYGMNPKKLQLFGISLGGHGIGFIGRHYYRLTGTKISRITGLDPAGPCFRHQGPEGRIDASDADFVDILHTNTEGYGMATPMGHIDYYINGGEFQISDIDIFPCGSLCSHMKSYVIWLTTVQYPDNFVAIKCDTVQDARDRNCYDKKPLITNLLGPKVNRTKTGIYYLATRNYYPYYLRYNGTKRECDPNQDTEKLNAETLLIL